MRNSIKILFCIFQSPNLFILQFYDFNIYHILNNMILLSETRNRFKIYVYSLNFK